MTGWERNGAAEEPAGTPAAIDRLAVDWQKSSYSNHQSACVEMARLGHESIGFRDSKDPGGPVLAFTRGEAVAFLSAVAGGELAERR